MQDKRRLRWFALAGLNLPFLVIYLIQLPDHEMYWFGPVVWVILTVRYFRRRTTNGEVWQPWNKHLCVCAVALSMLLSFLLGSPSYGMLGAALSVGWYLSTRSDRIIYSSMAYLSAVLFLTVRVPFFDGGLQWLNQMAVRLAGILLDVTGSLNLVTSDYGMSLPGRHFSLADLTHTFLSIPCLLCLCSVFLTFRDRRLLLQVSVLLIAVPFSIVLKSIHLFAGATMLNNWGVDALQCGWSLPPGIAVVVLTLLVWFSIDEFCSVFTASIPIERDDNFFIEIWNRLVESRPEVHGSKSYVPPRPLSEYMAQTTLVESGVSWIRILMSGWWYTRPWYLLTRGVIAGVVASVAVIAVASRPGSDRTDLFYDEVFQRSLVDGNDAQMELAIARLESSRSQGMALRFRIAKDLCSAKRAEEARPHLEAITPEDSEGFPAARIWLIEESQKPQTNFALTGQQRFTQLSRVVREDPRNARYIKMYADALLARNRQAEAEVNLKKAVVIEPRYAPDLIQVQIFREKLANPSLPRMSDEIRDQISDFRQDMATLLKEDQADTTARIAEARLAGMAGDYAGAEQSLRKGLRLTVDSVELRTTLSSIYLAQAQLASDQPLGHVNARDFILKALGTAPENLVAVRQLTPFLRPNSKLDHPSIGRALAYWMQKLEEDDEEIVGHIVAVAILHCASGRVDESIRVLESRVNALPILRSNLSLFLSFAGRTEKAAELAREAVKEIQSRFGQSSESNLLVVQALIEGGLNVEAVRFIDSLDQTDQTAKIRELKSLALCRQFDLRVYQDTRFLGSSEAVSLLDAVLEAVPASTAGISRLARIVAHGGESKQSAASRLTRLQATGQKTTFILTSIATYALLADHPEDAIAPLEAALALKVDPTVLNNLAVAKVRANPHDAAAALKLAEQALQLAPGYYEILNTRAEILIALGKMEAARADVETVLERHKDSKDAKKLLRILNKQ